MIDPVRNVYDAEFCVIIAYNNGFDSGVDYHAFAHAAAASVFNIIVGVTFFSDKIKGGTDHVFSCGADDCVCFGVNASAKLISFASRNIKFLS